VKGLSGSFASVLPMVAAMLLACLGAALHHPQTSDGVSCTSAADTLPS
jgi:hypothetical protein